jgi:Phytanoyl-CoA dioxygenase (PhyH)
MEFKSLSNNKRGRELRSQQVYASFLVAACLLLLSAAQQFAGFATRGCWSSSVLLCTPSSCCRTVVGSTTTTTTVFSLGEDATAVAFAARALAGEQQTIQRALVEEELLTTRSSTCKEGASRYPLQEPSPEQLQAAIQQNNVFWKEQQRLTRGRRRRKSASAAATTSSSSSSGTGGLGFQSSKKKTTKKNNTVMVKTTLSDVETEAVEPDHIAFNPKLDLDGYAAIVRTLGAVRKNQVLKSPQTVEPLRQFIDDELDRSLALIKQGKIREQARFARVLLKRNRYDMSLPFEQTHDGADIVMQALWELLGDGGATNPHGTVGYIFESALTQDAVLHEFGALISDPASDRQILHPDMAHQGAVQTRTGPPFLTCFVAVQDVEAAMGPTEILLSTNTMEAHEAFANVDVRDDFLRQVPSVALALLNQGDAAIYDTTTLHAGTANRSNKRRRIFYCTFRSISMKDDRTVDEPGSIRADLLERQLSLRDVRKALHDWHNRRKELQCRKELQ